MYIKSVIGSINWKLLREQKVELLGAIRTLDDLGYPVTKLQGVVALLDSIQDSAVEEEIASEEEVFGVIEEGVAS